MSLRTLTSSGFAFAAFLSFTDAVAQQVVPLDRIRDHINQRVVVEGTVADARRQRSGEVWMSLDRNYPRGPLVVVLTAEVLKTLPDYAAYRGKRVRVDGQVRPGALEGPPPPTRSQGAVAPSPPSKPHIVLEDAGRITILTP